MIRDGDGKDSRKLRAQLTNYYRERAKQDYGNLPRVTDRNVLILKYYSFEKKKIAHFRFVNFRGNYNQLWLEIF